MQKWPLSILFLVFVTLLSGEEGMQEGIPPQTPYQELLEEGKKVETQDFATEFMKMMGVLALILIALLVLSWLSKRLLSARMTSMNVESNIKIIEQRPIAPKVTVFLLDINGVGFALTQSPQGITSLGRIPLQEFSTEE